jgi:hypothetical protein
MKRETRRTCSHRIHRKGEVAMMTRVMIPAEEARGNNELRRIAEDHANGPGRPTHHGNSANESGRTAPPMGRL